MKLTIHKNVPPEDWTRVAGIAARAVAEGNPVGVGPRHCALYGYSPLMAGPRPADVIIMRTRNGMLSARLNIS